MHVKVRVQTGARRERFRKLSDERFELAVRELAAENRANARVVALIAEHFRVPVNIVRIVNGHHRPSKLLLIDV